jgi:deoxycytidine triphosphate deaminase
MIVVISGSRDFTDLDYFSTEMDGFLLDLNSQEKVLMVSGGARGTDTLAKDYAEKNGIEFKEFLADWDTHGKKAGILRNLEMLEVADQVVAFWNGKSPGTTHMIEQCLKRRIPITVFEV